MEIIKRIKDFEDYAITTEGKIISYKYKNQKLKKLTFVKMDMLW